MASRAEQKAERRVALIEGALNVLHEHGLAGFTTGRIAAAAGIAQSGFYKYWPDRDAALHAVAEHVGLKVLSSVREARLAVGNDPARLHESFAGALRAMLEQRRTTELFLRFRREPGPLGDLYRMLLDRARAELHVDMIEMGIVTAEDPMGRRLAMYTVTAMLGTVELAIDGLVDDIDEVASDLGLFAAAVLEAR